MSHNTIFPLPVEAGFIEFLELSCALCKFFPWDVGTTYVLKK